MALNDFAAWLGSVMASDAALMMMSMLFGLFLGMLWSGRSFPRRLPRSFMRNNLRRTY